VLHCSPSLLFLFFSFSPPAFPCLFLLDYERDAIAAQTGLPSLSSSPFPPLAFPLHPSLVCKAGEGSLSTGSFPFFPFFLLFPPLPPFVSKFHDSRRRCSQISYLVPFPLFLPPFSASLFFCRGAHRLPDSANDDPPFPPFLFFAPLPQRERVREPLCVSLFFYPLVFHFFLVPRRVWDSVTTREVLTFPPVSLFFWAFPWVWSATSSRQAAGKKLVTTSVLSPFFFPPLLSPLPFSVSGRDEVR